jgi:hypothetical protein
MLTKLEFAQYCLSNAQELTRTIDMKASFLLSAVGLLTTALGIVAASAIGGSAAGAWQWLKVFGIICTLIYLLVSFNIIYISTKVFRASSPSINPNTTAPGLIFPLLVLQRSKKDGKVSEEVYLDKLRNASTEDLLHDYAHQIVEVSNIYESKQQQINLGITRFRWLSLLWVVTMLLLVGVLVSPT